MSKVDYATLKKGGFMRQKQKNNFSLRLACVGGTLTSENLKKGVSLKSEFFKIVDEDKNTSKEDKEEIYNLAMNLFNGEEIN